MQHAEETAPGHHFNAGGAATEQLRAEGTSGPVEGETSEHEDSHGGGLLSRLGFGKVLLYHFLNQYTVATDGNKTLCFISVQE